MNETDFATLEDIADINQKYLICVKDAGGSYYAFDIRSLVEYIMTEIGSGR